MALTKVTGAGIGTVTNTFATSNIPTLTATQFPTGAVLQVLNTFDERTAFNLSTSFQEFLNVTITPSNSSTKILVLVTITADLIGDSHFDAKLERDISGGATTEIGGTNMFTDTGNHGSANQHGIGYSMSFLDTHGTTSAVEYKFSMKENSGGDVRMSNTGPASITVMEIKA